MEWTRFDSNKIFARPKEDGQYLIAGVTVQGQGPNVIAFAYWRHGEWQIGRESRQTGLYPHTIAWFASLPSLPAGPILESVSVVGQKYYADWTEVDAEPESSIIQNPGGETDE